MMASRQIAARPPGDGSNYEEQMGDTRHQLLQKSLAMRSAGGPHEQVRSVPWRLQGTRSCEITHSSLHEPLTSWKNLEPMQPRWPHAFRRYHLNHGIRVVDNDTIVVSARDKIQKTQTGLVRSSSGTVTYSQTQRQKAEIEVQELAEIMAGSGQLAWTPKKLEHIFKERTGRSGVWVHYDLGIRAFLICFPKTFELYGREHEYVRLRRARNSVVLDHPEEAMARLARARSQGSLQQNPTVPGTIASPSVALPSLKSNRLKVGFLPHDEPGTDYGQFGAYRTF
mmetsp:Transcript_87082/g.219250  ORF Transcript_87082/g.219250 Transcript_87082/m.219250 type:complete len:282 (+) Transcript_87082:73-918(+)